MEKIEKRLVDQKTSLTKINNCIEIEIENRFKKLEGTHDTKLNEMNDKQEELPCNIKSAWKPQTNIQPQKLKVTMHETLAEQEKQQLDLGKREQNLILFNVKESVLEYSDQRKQEDLNFFDTLCKEGLKSEHPPTVLNAIRLGKSSTATEPVIRPRPLKLVLENRDEKITTKLEYCRRKV